MHRQVNIPHITTAFITLILFALLIFTTDGSSVSTAASSAPESFEQADDFNQPTRSAQDQQAEYDQQVTPRFTLVLLPTATRTPTPIKLGNFVWDDLDKDGRQDAGEPGIPGVTVQLWNSTKTSLYAQTTTNASGIYSLTAPIPGQYRIRVLAPAGAGFTLKDQGVDDTRDSDISPIGPNTGFTDTIFIASNVISITKIDAGLINVPATPTPTQTFTPSQTPTSTEPVAEETLVRPAGIDTLAIFGKKDKTFTLIDTLDTNPPSSSFMIYLSSAPKKGKFIMGDWDGDGQQTPALFKKGTLWYTNQIGAAPVWPSVRGPGTRGVPGPRPSCSPVKVRHRGRSTARYRDGG